MIDLTEFESRAVPLRALGVVVSQNGMQLARKLWDDGIRFQQRFLLTASVSVRQLMWQILQEI